MAPGGHDPDMDLRPLPEEGPGADVFARSVRYAFSPQTGPPLEFTDEHPDPPAQPYGLYDGGDDPVSVCASYDFRLQVRDAWLSAGGVSAVATPPEHRRQGYVEAMLRALCRRYRADNVPLAVLWPFKHAFYAAFGWATCSRHISWTADPSTLRSAVTDDGTWMPVGADAWQQLDAVYRGATADRPLALDRWEAWWRERSLRRWETDPYAYLLEQDGEPAAYVIYTVENEADRRLVVTEHAAVNLTATRSLLGFLANHDSQVDTVTFRTAVDHPLHALVTDPDQLEADLSTGAMARVVDVAGTLEALAYPAATDAAVTLGVTDPLLDTISGAYELVVGNGTATVTQVDDDPAVGDARLGVGSLAQLAVGYRSAADLAATGDLTADAATVDRLGRLFPETTPYLQEHF